MPRPRSRPVGYLFAALPTALLYDPNVNDAAVRVFAAILDLGKREPLRIYRKDLGAALGRSPDAVSDATSRLVAAGWLTVEQDPRSGPNTYTPRCIRPEVEADPPTPRGESAPHPYEEGSSILEEGEEDDPRLTRFIRDLAAEGKDPEVLARIAGDLPGDWTHRDVIHAYQAAVGRDRHRPANIHHDDPTTDAQRAYRAQVAAAWGET